MASIVDAFNEALTDDFAVAKFIVYGLPVYYVATLFVQGKTANLPVVGTVVGVLFFALLTAGINNVRMNRKEILTLNPLKLIFALLKGAFVVGIQGLIWGSIGYKLAQIEIPFDYPHANLIFSILLWGIIGSVVLTAYLSFAKYLKVLQGFNLKVIFNSCVDVLISFLFFIPQFAIANFILIGPVVYIYSVFNWQYDNWTFVAYCSVVFVINISILANYLAQTAFEYIKGNNEEYHENVNVNLIDDVAERIS